MFVGQTGFKLTAAAEQRAGERCSDWSLLESVSAAAADDDDDDDDVLSVDEEVQSCDEEPKMIISLMCFISLQRNWVKLDSTNRHVSGKYLVQICVS